MRRLPAPTGFSYPASNPPPLRLVLWRGWTQRPATISQRPTNTPPEHENTHTHVPTGSQNYTFKSVWAKQQRSYRRCNTLNEGQHKHRVCSSENSFLFGLVLTSIHFGVLHQHKQSNRKGCIFFWWSHHICGYKQCVSMSTLASALFFFSLSHTHLPLNQQINAVKWCIDKHKHIT